MKTLTKEQIIEKYKEELIVEILWRYSTNKEKENVTINFTDSNDIATDILNELSQFQQPVTDENIIVNIRRILVDYHRRDDYDLTKAENDMLCLFRNTFISLKSQPERGEQHDTCDGCQMFQDCGCMLDDSCPECVDHHLWTPKEQP